MAANEFRIFTMRFLACSLLLTFSSLTARAAEVMTVSLASGRSFTAYVDSRTNEDRLWLRFGQATVMLRPIDWDRVTGGKHDGQALSASDVQTVALQIKSDRDSVETGQSARPSADRPTRDRSDAERAREALGFTATAAVRSVEFDAQIANWDADVDVDGLLLFVRPLGGYGEVVPVGATLEVELITTKKRKFSDLPQHSGRAFERIGRWSRRISADEVTSSGVTVRLPFQADHPEFNTDVEPFGLVHIKLSVPGHGVFSDSQDLVRIRPYAPIRDALQRDTGNRFSPSERTGR